MLILGDKICDSTDGSCKYGCTRATGCKGETFRREYAADHVRALAEAVVKDAQLYGLVVTIETRPLQPLAMGHHEMVVDVRPARVLAQPTTSGWTND